VLFAAWAATSSSFGQAADSSNTVVRFHIATGQRDIGDIDVELFDSDKPATVQNFLLYLRNGSYSNVLLHRVISNFVAQGGGYTNSQTITNSRPFTQYGQIRYLGQITNEFFVGPTLSNTFGTIAMARIGGITNSATSEWFFNLGNNSIGPSSTTNLQIQNGGFTVFGQVLPRSTNLLTILNSRAISNGVVKMSDFFGQSWSVFDALPVDYVGYGPPRNYDLFYVTVSELSPPTNTDTTPPTVEITSPGPTDILTNATNATITVTGTASDDQQVARVVYFFGDTTARIADGTTNWSVTITNRPGTNGFSVESVDEFGNVSQVVTQKIYYFPSAALNLQIVGDGTVSGASTGQVLQLGKFYTLMAHPDPNQIFVGWSGSVTSKTDKLTFEFQTNTVIIATFKPNPFPGGQGTYSGLIVATNHLTQDSIGAFTLTMRANRKFLGGLIYRGGHYTFNSQFTRLGQGGLQGNLFGQSVTIAFQYDETNAPPRMQGAVFIAGSIAEAEGYRIERRSPTNDVARPGKYTYVMSGSPNAIVAPGGAGSGTVTITPAGAVRMTGTLGEGTVFRQTASLLAQDRWRVFVTPDKGKGNLLGWLVLSAGQTRYTTNTNVTSFSTNITVVTNTAPPLHTFSGSLYWFKQSHLTNLYYPFGFTNTLTVQGGLYTRPADGERLFNWTNGVAIIQGGNLPAPSTNRIVLNDDNTFTVSTGGDQLDLSVDLATGKLTGGFVHPMTQSRVEFQGEAVRGYDVGGASFNGPDQTGSVTIQKQ